MPVGPDSHSSSCIAIWGSFESLFLGIMMKVLTPRTQKRGLKRPPNSYAGARMRVTAHRQILQTPAQFPFLKFNLVIKIFSIEKSYDSET